MRQRVLTSLLLLASAVPRAAAQNPNVIPPQFQTAGAAATGSVCLQNTDCAVWDVSTVASVTVQITGTFSGTLTFETVGASAQTWVATSVANLGDGTVGTTTTTTGQFALVNSGLSGLRVRMTSYTSGTATLSASAGKGLLPNAAMRPDLSATYWLATADARLPNAKVLGALSTGLVLNTTTTGAPSQYAGTSCTNQFPRSLNSSGAATCATVVLADTSGIAGSGANSNITSMSGLTGAIATPTTITAGTSIISPAWIPAAGTAAITGALTVSSTSLLTGVVTIGVLPSTTGTVLNLPSVNGGAAKTIWARNSANGADMQILSYNSSDAITFGNNTGNGGVSMFSAGGTAISLTSGANLNAYGTLVVVGVDSTHATAIDGAVDGTMYVKTRAGADTAILKAATHNATVAYQANGTPGQTETCGTTFTTPTFTMGLLTASTCVAPPEIAQNWVLPGFAALGYAVPTVQDLADFRSMRQELSDLKAELASLKSTAR